MPRVNDLIPPFFFPPFKKKKKRKGHGKRKRESKEKNIKQNPNEQLASFFIFLYHILLYLKQPFFSPSLISPPLLSYVYPLLFVCPFQFYSAFFSHSCSFVKTTDVWKTNTKNRNAISACGLFDAYQHMFFLLLHSLFFFLQHQQFFFLFKDLISWLRHKNKQTNKTF